MSVVHGKNMICDACGYIIFVERKTCASVPAIVYEELPDDWSNSDDFGDMCPNCTKNFSRFVTNMFGIDKVPEKWRAF